MQERDMGVARAIFFSARLRDRIDWHYKFSSSSTLTRKYRSSNRLTAPRLRHWHHQEPSTHPLRSLDDHYTAARHSVYDLWCSYSNVHFQRYLHECKPHANGMACALKSSIVPEEDAPRSQSVPRVRVFAPLCDFYRCLALAEPCLIR